MLEHLSQTHSVLRDRNEAFSNEIFCLMANLNMVWERVSDRLDFFIRLLDVLRLERRTAVKHRV